MDETNGLRLIEKLKQDPENFRKERRGYQLLEAYFNGLSTDTLHDLLRYEDKYIRELTLWIISELGETTAKDFLEEAAIQMNDDNPAIYYRSSEIVACYGTDKYMDDFMRVFAFFEHSNAKIRDLSMFIISGLSERLKEAYAYSVSGKILGDSHEKGLLSLIHINTLTASDITAMLNSDDSIIRKYGVIAAGKVYEKYPDIIQESVNSEDLDVQEYSKTRVAVEAKMAQLRDRRRKH